MDAFRRQARVILQSLEHQVSSYPDLCAAMLEVRQELDDGYVGSDADVRRTTDLTPIHVSEAKPSRTDSSQL